MFIDIHAHTRVFDGPRQQGDFSSHFATPAELMAKLKPLGVRAVVALPTVNPDYAWYVQSVQEIVLAAQRYPDFVIPFMNIDPRQGNNSATSDLGYFMRYWQDRGCRGLGEVTANMPFDHPLMENLFRHAEACGLSVTFHIAPRQWDYYGIIDHLGLPLLEGALRRFPNLTFLGHSQPFWAEISGDLTEEQRNGYPRGPVTEGGAVVRLMRQYPNLCGDLSAGSGHNAVSRDAEFGYAFMSEFQDRLFFGTDVCDPRNETPLIGFLNDAVAGGHISHEVYEKIAWKNAERLLGL